MDATGTEAKARTVLLGLGFPESTLEKPFTSLSGGWRTRCDLACCLVVPTDVLMLDEPTNFLDLPAVIWLQKHLVTMHSTSVIVVTHDRDFADAIAEELIVLRQSKLERFPGNLSAYEHEKMLQIRRFTKMKEAQDRKTRHMEDTIEQNVRAAKRTGDDKKLRQAASRRKKMEERTGLEVNARGGRFKINRDYGGFHNTKREDIKIPDMDPPIRILLPPSPPHLRFPGPLLSFEKVAFAYPGSTSILRHVNFVIHPGERLGIAGLNGSGKSTVVKLAIGSDGSSAATAPGSLRSTRGTVTRHSRARVEHFSQFAVEELGQLGSQQPGLTALSHLCSMANGELNEQDAHVLLGGLGLKGGFASDVPLSALSGGQKVCTNYMLWGGHSR
jgi:ATP-binding cassette subfamily F protein 3